MGKYFNSKTFVVGAVMLLTNFLPAKAQQVQRIEQSWDFVRQDLGGIWEAIRPSKPGAPETVPIWEKVQLPHSYNASDAVDPFLNYYQGAAWYRSNFKIDNPYTEGRTLLHFEGVGQKAKVYVYDQLVGEHVGGYDEWSVDITEAVAEFKKNPVFTSQFKGEIPISVRTDNTRDLEIIPSDLSDFNLYGGIYRYVNLVYNPAVAVDKLFATATVDAAGKKGELLLKARFLNPHNRSQVQGTVSLKDPQGKLVFQEQVQLAQLNADMQLAQFEIPKPALWSTEKPQLYTLEYTMQVDGQPYKKTEKIGFRHFEFVQQGPFKLNGKRLLLRGTHRHEDHAGVGPAMTEDMMRQEMQMMKDMGVNFIRLGHYQQSRIILDLCDSLGILVWEEEPWCRGGLGGDSYKDMARRMMTNMIEQHYNHPSIIIWGLGNENDWPNDFPEFDQQKIRTFMKEINDLSHRLDPNRKTAIRRCDFCKDIVDVYSPSIWAGWYRGVYTEYKDITDAEIKRVNHFLHVEWGGDSHALRHSEEPDRALTKIKTGEGGDERAGDASLVGGAPRVSKDGDWSESYIVNLIDWHLKEQEQMPYLTGTAYWPFKDFSTPVRPENPVPYMNQKGVIERDFTKKESFYVFQSYWTEEPMAHIYGHSWPTRWGKEGELKMVKVFSNCDEAELFLNGKSVGTRKRNVKQFPASGLVWEVPFQAGKNSIRVVAKKGKVTVTDEIEQYYETRTWGKPASLKLEQLNTDEEGTMTVQVTLLDAQGVPCLDAQNFVEFGFTGDGRLIDNMGTSRASRRVGMYNGRALISVENSKGNAVVSVKSEGLETQLLKLK